MDKNQDSSSKESLVNLSTLPAELLAHIVSFLSSTRDKVNLRYISRWLRCVIDGMPSMWNEFVWPFYNNCEECIVKDMLKTCGQNIHMLSFPNCKIPPTLVEMLQYCSNVQHLSLPSTTLDSEQLKNIMHHMRYLQILELKVHKVDDGSEVKQLLLYTGQLKELTIISSNYDCYYLKPSNLFEYWKTVEFRPLQLNLIGKIDYSSFILLLDYVIDLTALPCRATANFRVYSKEAKVPLMFFPTPPIFQLQFEGGSGQVITPCAKLSDFGMLGLDNNLAMMTNCQDGETTTYRVQYQYYESIAYQSSCILRFSSFSRCMTHVDLSHCCALHSGHLEQLGITCLNLQRLNLSDCSRCLQSLRGLQAIACNCHNLQGLNLLGIHVSEIEDLVLLWEILSAMKLNHLAIRFCLLGSQAINKEKLISLYQKCQTIRGMQCDYCKFSMYENISMLSYFPSLNCCYFKSSRVISSVVQDVVGNCKELKSAHFNLLKLRESLSLTLTHGQNLQQFCINSPYVIISND